MRQLALAIVFSAVLMPLSRAEEWAKTYNITGQPDLRVQTSDANIHVDTWDKKAIEARVTTEGYKIGERGIQIIEHQAGDAVDIEIRFPHDVINFNFGLHSHRVDINIHMPREGRVSLHTGDGNIELLGLKGQMDLETSDGSQQIDSVDGSLRARSGDGKIVASGRFDGLDLTAGDGRIETRVLPGSVIQSGWTLHAGDGSVTLQVPGNLAADVDLRTGDGHVTVDMPISVEGRLGEKSIHGKLNGGGNPLTIHTGDGSIRLEKS